MANNDLYSMKLSPTQVAGYLVMVIFCLFPPLMLLMSGISFGPSPLLTILVASAVGGTLGAVLVNWPSNKGLAAAAGLIAGVGTQVMLFACMYWLGGGRMPKVVIAAAMLIGALPGYLLFKLFSRSTASTETRTR
jgi:hypothetical protein